MIAEKTWLIVRPLKGLAMFKREEDEVQNSLDAKILEALSNLSDQDTQDEVEEALDSQLMQLFQLMDNLTAYDDDFDKMATATAKLYALRKNPAEERSKAVADVVKLIETRKKDTISLETWAAIATNLTGMFLILNHERAHIIASKAFGLLKKII
jgi:hypothetical protein